MTVIERLAAFIQDGALHDPPPQRLDRVKRHVLDTLGAMLGATCLTGRTAGLAYCSAAARSSEADDIHLASCTTPGAAIVPTALHLASTGQLNTWGEFSAAVLAGYEVIIRMGMAINGPAVLANQIWPTYFAAPLGAAATAARALQLTPSQTAGALATALCFSTGTASPARSEHTSRWLAFGVAVSNGLLAAQSVRQDFEGAADLLERYDGHIAGLDISEENLLDALGTLFLFDETGMKPYPAARQGLAAIEACRALNDSEPVDVSAVTQIVVGVPAPQIRIIDDAGAPKTRIASIAGVQYQIALALIAPERLLDIRRSPPYADDRIRELMAKVSVERALDLEQYYPETWPGRVEVRTGHGRRIQTVLHPRGDARNPLGWDEVIEKFQRMAEPRLSAAAARVLCHDVRRLCPADAIPAALRSDTLMG